MLFSWAKRSEMNYGSSTYHYANMFHISLASSAHKTLCGRATDGHLTADEAKATTAKVCERCKSSAITIRTNKKETA